MSPLTIIQATKLGGTGSLQFNLIIKTNDYKSTVGCMVVMKKSVIFHAQQDTLCKWCSV